MKVHQVLRMKEGTSDNSYAKASYIQRQALMSTKVIKEQAIKEFYLKHRPSTLSIADLGCSSCEHNTLSVILELIETVDKARKELRREPHEYQVHLNDLPENDFNTLFRSLARFHDKLVKKIGDGLRHCFVNVVPGSFYGRLFPDNSLHFVHSSYSLQWLSQVPEGIEDNKGNIYLTKTSPPSVIDSFYEQFSEDFTAFLSCRSKEVIEGGVMVLTIVGRETNEPYSKECSYMWQLLANVINDMVLEGFIEEEKLKRFNIPNYYPSPSELKCFVEREGSFGLNQVHIFRTKWENTFEKKNKTSKAYDFVKCMRSVAETILISHFGEKVIDEMFKRYHQIVQDSMAVENNAFANYRLINKEGITNCLTNAHA